MEHWIKDPRSTSVVPLLGTWIEMRRTHITMRTRDVVPLLGTWIEITMQRQASEKM